MKTIGETNEAALHRMFEHPSTIADYGSQAVDVQAINSLSDLLEKSSAAKLSDTIKQIVEALDDADPEKISGKPSLWMRLTGQATEAKVRYAVAKRNIDALLERAAQEVANVRSMRADLGKMRDDIEIEADLLRQLIDAGQAFLKDHPTIGTAEAGSLTFDKPRERFSRRLANLATLLASHEMSVIELTLRSAQTTDMLDRFKETVDVLVPIWRRHVFMLTSSKHLPPDLADSAEKAHLSLKRSLTESMAGLDP